MPARLAGKRLLIANVQSDIRYYQKHKESVKREERLSFGEELLLALKENVMQEKERYFSEYQGFDVILPRHMEVDKPYVWLKRKGSNQYSVAMNTDKVLGGCQKMCIRDRPKFMRTVWKWPRKIMSIAAGEFIRF